jgi:repressor LexA
MGRKKLFSKEQILEAINRLILRKGVPPTIEELRASLGIGSKRTILRYLDLLVEEGDIQRWSGARGLRPLRAPKKGLETRAVPVIGEVPAGPMMVAEENVETWVRVPKEYLKSGSHFFLRVRGNSMNRAQVSGVRIEDGDLILVRQQPVATSGQIVVALIDGEATIKRLDHGSGYYLLKPESTNPAHKPIIAPPDFAIAGVVQRVFKKGIASLST